MVRHALMAVLDVVLKDFEGDSELAAFVAGEEGRSHQ